METKIVTGMAAAAIGLFSLIHTGAAEAKNSPRVSGPVTKEVCLRSTRKVRRAVSVH